MIKLNHIRQAAMRKLNSKWPTIKVYGEEVPADFKRPAFFVSIIPESIEPAMAGLVTKQILVEITYYPENGTNKKVNEICWDIADDINDLFQGRLLVKGGTTEAPERRSFVMLDPVPKIVDKALHYIFTIQFTDEYTEDPNAEVYSLMETLTLQIDK